MIRRAERPQAQASPDASFRSKSDSPSGAVFKTQRPSGRRSPTRPEALPGAAPGPVRGLCLPHWEGRQAGDMSNRTFRPHQPPTGAPNTGLGGSSGGRAPQAPPRSSPAPSCRGRAAGRSRAATSSKTRGRPRSRRRPRPTPPNAARTAPSRRASWFQVCPPPLLEDTAPSARLVAPRAQAAPPHPGAQPGHI